MQGKYTTITAFSGTNPGYKHPRTAILDPVDIKTL
jgi:hypothetical protein